MGWAELFFIGLFWAIIVIPCWVILRKAGFSPWLSLVAPLPGLNLILLYFVAFSPWPKERKS